MRKINLPVGLTALRSHKQKQKVGQEIEHQRNRGKLYYSAGTLDAKKSPGRRSGTFGSF